MNRDQCSVVSGQCKTIKAPFPWFGAKSRASALVWERFGEVKNFIEPFAGSLAVLLGRPTPFSGTETVNDLDGLVANFWRALRDDPEAVAEFADWPVNENDLHARHVWLVERKDTLQNRLEGDPDFYDAKIAGWWAWGIACWIGGGFCRGKGPWRRAQNEDGEWVLSKGAEPAIGAWRQRVHPGDAGRGVKRQRVHLSNGQGVNRKLVHLGDAGRGVKRQRVHLGDAGQGGLSDWFDELAARLARVRVCCGDWRRVCGPTPTVKVARPCAVFLDPPYADTAKRDSDLYRIDSESVAHDVRDWALAHGDDPRYRICLAGYDGEHVMPRSWQTVPWKAAGGYASQKRSSGDHSVNSHKERLWFSPHCLRVPIARKLSTHVL